MKTSVRFFHDSLKTAARSAAVFCIAVRTTASKLFEKFGPGHGHPRSGQQGPILSEGVKRSL